MATCPQQNIAQDFFSWYNSLCTFLIPFLSTCLISTLCTLLLDTSVSHQMNAFSTLRKQSVRCTVTLSGPCLWLDRHYTFFKSTLKTIFFPISKNSAIFCVIVQSSSTFVKAILYFSFVNALIVVLFVSSFYLFLLCIVICYVLSFDGWICCVEFSFSCAFK